MRSIDINCDMGESFGQYRIGNDAAIFPYITSCNIACGMHAGDPTQMDKTIDLALKHGVQIGAHPGYPDLMGFGRRDMAISERDLLALIRYQVSALKGMIESKGGRLSYVKPHGALYNKAARSPQIANIIMTAINSIDPNLVTVGLAGSIMEQEAHKMGCRFIAEAFADRRYAESGRLTPRHEDKAVITDPHAAVAQVISIVLSEKVKTTLNGWVPLRAQTICIHGDNASAVPILRAIDQTLTEKNVQKVHFHL